MKRSVNLNGFQPHHRTKYFTAQDFVNTCRAIGMTDEEIRQAIANEATGQPSTELEEASAPMTNQIQTTNSKGHIANIGEFEYFTLDSGDLYRAPLANPIMPDGYRGGGRWEAPVHMAAEWLDTIKAQAN